MKRNCTSRILSTCRLLLCIHPALNCGCGPICPPSVSNEYINTTSTAESRDTGKKIDSQEEGNECAQVDDSKSITIRGAVYLVMGNVKRPLSNVAVCNNESSFTVDADPPVVRTFVIKDHVLFPNEIVIRSGDIIRFSTDMPGNHHMNPGISLLQGAATPIDVAEQVFDTKRLLRNRPQFHIFRIICDYHPMEQASVLVVPFKNFMVSDNEGKFSGTLKVRTDTTYVQLSIMHPAGYKETRNVDLSKHDLNSIELVLTPPTSRTMP